jgi:hypothetical protein
MPTKFDFISPGVQLREIDQSQVPQSPENPGILLIGRARSGPAMKPIKVTNFNDFVDIFGNPMDGVRQADPWRQGNTGAPNYAAYAAQAYLAAGIGPVKYVRLLGQQLNTDTGNKAGWSMGSSFGPTLPEDTIDPGKARVSSSANSFGLFMIPSQSETGVAQASTLGAINANDAGTPGAFTILVPATAGGSGNTITITVENPIDANPAANEISVLSESVSSGATLTAGSIFNIIGAINGGAPASDVVYGAGAGDVTNGIAGLTAVQRVDATSDPRNAFADVFGTVAGGAFGNGITITDGTLQAATQGNQGSSPIALTGGVSHQITTGSLAAVFYTSGSAFAISSDLVSGAVGTSLTSSVSASTLFRGNAASYGVNVYLSGAASSPDANVAKSINFAGYNDSTYIRNVLNTDPTKFFNQTNYGSSLDNYSYFLGETFDVNVDRLSGNGGKNDTYYFIAGLGQTAPTAHFDDYQQEMTAAKSGWFIGAKPDTKYLFRLVALDDGEEFQKKFYCRIRDIRLATALQPRATFTLQLMRRQMDNWRKDIVEEEWTGLTLDPDSENYIVKKIGDTRQSWNSAEDKYDIEGLYPNMSNYVYVEMAENSGIVASDVPVGFIGPVRPAAVDITPTTAVSNTGSIEWIQGSGSIGMGNYSQNTHASANGSFIEGWNTGLGVAIATYAKINWPTFGMTVTGTNVGSDWPATSNFGLHHAKSNSYEHDQSFQDVARKRVAIDPHLAEGAATTTAAFVFTLEDIKAGSGVGGNQYSWVEGSYDDSTSVAGLAGSVSAAINKKIKQFNAPFFGGADGVDVRYADPFSDNRLDQGNTKYPYHTVQQAIEMVGDPEQVTYELFSVPGLIKSSLIQDIVSTVEDRSDALAIVDLQGIYQAPEDNGGTAANASVSSVISNLNTVYGLDSSYVCTYFPNVKLKDTESGNGTVLRAPPSVAGIGAIAQSEDLSTPWFAPAGFNRGGLTNLGGPGGPLVQGTVEHLNKSDRDDLYQANINPIAKFPSTNDTVVFGQKTLQQTPSALDRINVRRMMIYLKRHIGNIADTILFDQNVRTTWLRFKTRAEAVLAEVKAELGITEYKLVLDETTTTPDLIDRNIMYAKVFVKPARSIEFIAVDFIITRSGVEF